MAQKAKSKNAWIVHMSKIRKANPKLSKSRPGSPDFMKLVALAKKSYKKK